MYRIVHGNRTQTPDVEEFINLLNGLKLFDAEADLIVGRAPGRLDVMGGIADYSGSHVLEMPIAEATFVAAQRNEERTLRLVTLLVNEPRHNEPSQFTMPLTVFDGPMEYEGAREFFRQYPGPRWPAYVAGVFLVLMRELNVNFASGANVLISSRVPPGKGVSSSAALEVAVMEAVTEAFDIKINAHDKALLCQKVENLVVGAPCGVMDQMTAVFGEREQLLLLLCQPAQIKRMIKLPKKLMLWGIDSGIRHAVGGADYGSVRAGAFMGLRIIADLRKEVDYLANISPAEFEREYVAQLPERMSGEEFVTRYTRTSDPVTSIDPEKEYAIRMPTAHPIYENSRVQRFVELLDQCDTSDTSELVFDELGELMYESHRSYTSLGLNSAGTDLIVELVEREGPAAGLFGGRITGGGSGGTVAVLGDQTSRAAIERVAASYMKETGHNPYIFNRSSMGSLAFGHLRLRPARSGIPGPE